MLFTELLNLGGRDIEAELLAQFSAPVKYKAKHVKSIKTKSSNAWRNNGNRSAGFNYSRKCKGAE